MTTSQIPAAPPEPPDDDPAVLDDMASELDDDVADPDDSSELRPAEDAADETPDTTAICRGGPYNGRTVSVRCPKGFLLVDKANSKVYLYDHDASGVFTCRAADGSALDEDGRWRAAEEATYDVMAFEADPAVVEAMHP